jgi:hypothetical protein
MTTPLLVAYDNAPTNETRFFEKTVQSYGWDYTLIGMGETWEGWPTRMKAYRKHLDLLPEDRIVVLSDARDVVCMRGPKAFLEGFRTFGKDMVASMELTCSGQFNVPDNFKSTQCVPLGRYWAYHGIKTLPNRKFVNNGLLAGSVKALKPYFDWILEKGFTDDQFALGSYVNEFPDRVALDVEALLLHTSTFGVNAGIQLIHVQKTDSPTFAEFFGRGAFFLHIPGTKNKGQKVIYESVVHMIETGVCDATLSAPYGYAEPEWDEIF